MNILLAALLLPLTFADYNLEVYLRRFDVGQGFLANGTHCSSYWNIGDQCSIQLKIKVCHRTSCASTDAVDLGHVTTNANSIDFQGAGAKYGAWTNPQQFIGAGTYQGFDLSVEAIDWTTQVTIDSYATDQFATAYDINDFKYYSHDRGLVEPTLIALAWRVSGDVPTPAPPTEPPTTTTSEPTTTTTTPIPTTPPVFPTSTCDGVDKSHQTDGVKILTINGIETDVYCQFGSTGAYTVIQSRGEQDTTTFAVDLEQYYKVIGQPGPANNFWLGLENMYQITADKDANFSLMVEVCCNGVSTKQYYNNFSIGSKTSGYKLNADAILKGQGLDADNEGGAYGKDIGQPFRTYKSWHDEAKDDIYCDVINYISGDMGTNKRRLRRDTPSPVKVAEGTGGWWFGSCTNNLNGEYYPSDQETHPDTCKVNDDNDYSKKGTGIEFSTSKFTYNGQVAFTGISYTRARMAIYKGSSIPMGIPDNFCTPSN